MPSEPEPPATTSDHDSLPPILREFVEKQEARYQKEVAEPHDHPWRAAQAVTREAALAAEQLRGTCKQVREQPSGGPPDRLFLQYPPMRRLLAVVYESRRGVTTSFRLGLHLLAKERRPPAMIERMTGIPARRAQYLRSVSNAEIFDPRSGDQARVPDINPESVAWEIPSQRVSSDFHCAKNAARSVVEVEMNGDWGADKHRWAYFTVLRHAAQTLEEIELDFVGLLRRRGLSWESIGEVFELTAQGTIDRYAVKLTARQAYLDMLKASAQPNLRPWHPNGWPESEFDSRE